MNLGRLNTWKLNSRPGRTIVVVIPGVRYRDSDAFLTPSTGIIPLLESTGEFDIVEYARSYQATRTSAFDSIRCRVADDIRVQQASDGRPNRKFRMVQYSIIVEVRNTDVEAAEDLDRIVAVVVNTLTKRANKSYGGFCLPEFSEISSDDYNPEGTPASHRMLTGQFAYVTNVDGSGFRESRN
jgi:hypothetical protein